MTQLARPPSQWFHPSAPTLKPDSNEGLIAGTLGSFPAWWLGQCGQCEAQPQKCWEQPGEAGRLGHAAGRGQTGWPLVGLSLHARHPEAPTPWKLAMLLWAPQALLALLLPVLLTQGEGKAVGGGGMGNT